MQTRYPKERNGCKGKPSPERQNEIVRTSAGKTWLKGQHSQAPVIGQGILESLVTLKSQVRLKAKGKYDKQ